MPTANDLWGARAGAMDVFKERGFVALILLLLPVAGTPLSAQSPPDSIRTSLTDRYQGGDHAFNWRTLTNACADDTTCLREQRDLLAAALPDSALYDYAMAASMTMMKTRDAAAAIAFARHGMDLARRNQDTLPRGRLSSRIGYIYTNLTTQSDSAAHYLYRAIEILEDKYPVSTWTTYHHLAYLNDQLGLGEEAVHNIAKSYRLSRRTERRMDYGYALYHLITISLTHEARDTFNHYWPDYVAFRAGAKTKNTQHDAFLDLLLGDDEALNNLRNIVDDGERFATVHPSSQGTLLSNLAYGLQARGEYCSAEKYLRQGIRKTAELGRDGNLMRIYQDLTNLGERSGNINLVAEGLRASQALRDSIARREYREDIGRLEVEYETQKTRTDLAESELALSESLRQRNQLLLGGGGLALLTLLGFLFYQNRLKLQRLKTAVEVERREREVAEEQRKAQLSSLRSLIEGQETERSRVAKDLHDGLGGLLTTVKAHIASIPDTREAEQLLDRACTSVRRIAHNLAPQTLTETGLTGSLGDLAAQLRVQGYDVDLEIIGDPDGRLDLHRRAILLRIAQELTHNVVKHAGAESILIQLMERPAGFLLTVEDDGKGFNLDYARRSGGLGISSVQQRVDYLEGKVMYDSRTGEGTTVTVEV